MGYNVSDLYFAEGVSGSVITASTGSGTELLAANQNRKAVYIFNDSSAAAFIKFGPSGSRTNCSFMLPALSFYESYVPCPTTVISGVWTLATGSARVTEIT